MTNWSGRDLDEDLAFWAGEDRELVLDKPTIIEAFERLDRKLAQLNLKTVLHLAGSTQLLLDGTRTRRTSDVDILRIQHDGRGKAFVNAVREVADEMELNQHWMNQDVALVPGMPPRPDGGEHSVFEGSRLTVVARSDRQLLAMKFRAHRGQDWEDMRILVLRVGAKTFEQVREIHYKCFPHSPYSKFPDTEKDFLAGELRRRLVEWVEA